MTPADEAEREHGDGRPPTVAAVIVAYKSEEEIGACLSSLHRSVPNGAIACVVVDNSPGTGAGAIVKRDFRWVRYVAARSNLGFGRANNLGFSQIEPESEFVLFLNPDTVCNESALRHCITRLRSDPTIGLISPKLLLADGTMDLACRRSIPTLWDGLCRASGLAGRWPNVKLFNGYNLTHLPENGTYEVGAINGAFMFARREVFEAVASSALARVDGVPPVEDLRLKFKEGVPPLGGTPDEDLKLKIKEGDGRAESGAAPQPSPPVQDLSWKFKDARKGDSDGLLKAAEPDPFATTGGASEPQAYSLPPNASSSSAVFDERFFMYGDDLDLCIRVRKAGWRIVYDGNVSITHLKGVSVAKDYDRMASTIFDANRDVYLKHFNPNRSRLVAWKYHLAFGVWKRIALWRAKWRGHRAVRPV